VRPGIRLAVTAAAVFATEIVLMAVLAAEQGWVAILLDAAGVSALTVVFGFVLMARPLTSALEELRGREAEFRTIFEAAPIGMAVALPEGGIVRANPTFQRMIGYSEPELLAAGWDGITHPEDLVANRAAAARVACGETDGYRLSKRYLRKDGTLVWADLTVAAVRATSGALRMLVALVEDISLRKAAEQMERLALSVFHASGEGMMVTDSRCRIVTVNRAFCRITGYDRRDVLGRTPNLLSSGRHDRAFFAEMWGRIASEGRWQGEIWNRRKDGTIYLQRLVISTLRTPDGDVANYVAVLSDVTGQHHLHEQLRHSANHDALTGLPNRALLRDRLRQGLAGKRRDGGRLTLMFLDLDGFKSVNDTAGHLAGDAVLQEVAARLNGLVRGSDTVARLGGDEFVVMLLDTPGRAGVEKLAAKVIAAVAEPVPLPCGGTATVGVSIGIAGYPENGDAAEALMACADHAMYQAKAEGKNRCRFAAVDAQPLAPAS